MVYWRAVMVCRCISAWGFEGFMGDERLRSIKGRGSMLGRFLKKDEVMDAIFIGLGRCEVEAWVMMRGGHTSNTGGDKKTYISNPMYPFLGEDKIRDATHMQDCSNSGRWGEILGWVSSIWLKQPIHYCWSVGIW